MKDVQAMSDWELLAELLGRDQAKQLHVRSIRRLLQSGRPHQELRPLYLSQEIWKRMHLHELQGREVFSSPEAVKGYLSMVYMRKTYEVFMVLFLDAQNRLICAEEMFRGTLTQTSVYPREVVKRALDHHAASVILSHNHPSGSLQPSRADEALTQALKSALALVDVRVLDHVIWAGGGVASLAEIGLL